MKPKNRERGTEWSVERQRYLHELVSEYGSTGSQEARRQVLANLANFAYDPINFEYLRSLNVIRIFTDALTSIDDAIVEYAIGGLANLASSDVDLRMISTSVSIENLKACFQKQNAEIIVSALTVVYYILTSSVKDGNSKWDYCRAVDYSLAGKLMIWIRIELMIPVFRCTTSVLSQCRSVAQIPPWEYHIRMSPADGRKVPCKDIVDRFKRLNNGMWIRAMDGRKKKRYQKSEPWLSQTLQHYTLTPVESHISDRTVNNFWLRPKYYVDDIYAPYQVRHGLNKPRVNYAGEMMVRMI